MDCVCVYSTVAIWPSLWLFGLTGNITVSILFFSLIKWFGYWIISFGYSITICLHMFFLLLSFTQCIHKVGKLNKIAALFTQCHRKSVKLWAASRRWRRRRKKYGCTMNVVHVGNCVNFKAYRTIPSNIVLRQDTLRMFSNNSLQKSAIYMKC